MSTAQGVQFSIIFLQTDAIQFHKLKLHVPQNKTVRHLYEYLSSFKGNPFKSFFLTNKIKEKPQFSEEKSLFQIKDQCKQDKQSCYVLLCYEEKKEGTSLTGSTIAEIEKKKAEDEKSCIIM